MGDQENPIPGAATEPEIEAAKVAAAEPEVKAEVAEAAEEHTAESKAAEAGSDGGTTPTSDGDTTPTSEHTAQSNTANPAA